MAEVGADQGPAGRKVLVIDDSMTIRRSAEIFLLQAGCQVLLAEDGFAALPIIIEQQPEVVFCDVTMPQLDGYQTCRLLKQHTRWHRLPIILLTSRDGAFDRARGRLAGADAYLTKPFTKDSLIAALTAALPHQEANPA